MDMCVAPDGDEHYLITTENVFNKSLGVYAYNMSIKVLEWSVIGKLEEMEEKIGSFGITTDGRGHLFVCDVNNMCIQMFCVRDGAYMGALMIRGLGEPYRVEWCEATTALVVHDGQRFIRVVHIT